MEYTNGCTQHTQYKIYINKYCALVSVLRALYFPTPIQHLKYFPFKVMVIKTFLTTELPGDLKIVKTEGPKSSSCERCWRPHQKILFPTRVMIFWKSRFACSYSMHEKLKLRYPKTALMYLLEKTTHPKVLKLGLYTFLGWISTDLMKGCEKFLFFFGFYRP